jgi:hypothetical protein
MNVSKKKSFMPAINTILAFYQTLSIHQVLGEVKAQALEARLAHSLAFSTSPLHLWDFTHGSLAFELDEGGRLLCTDRSGPLAATAGKRTALVCPNELDHGLFRLVHAFAPAGHYPRQIRAFRSMRAAQRWLGTCTLCRRTQTIDPELACSRQCGRSS